MKTRAAAEADFQGREGNTVVDFWSADVSGLYETSYRLRWERHDRRDPNVRGEETLTLSFSEAVPGRAYTLPSEEIRADYTMATPAKGQGARAVELRGVVRVVENGKLWLDLKARMERVDVPGARFDEAVTGLFVLTK